MSAAVHVLALLQAFDPQVVPPGNTSFFFWSLFKIVVVFTVLMVTVALLTLMERKVAAFIQDRPGPNRVGPGGLLQPAADGLKNFMKEETNPDFAYKPLFTLAPAMAFIPALLTFAVIPFAAPLPTPWGLVDMVVADLPVGFLYILAIASLGVYGIVLAGWASNSKYSLLGGLRSSAQMVSYEIAMGMSTIPVLLLAGNVALKDIIAQQVSQGWNVLLVTVSFFIFLVAAFAETNRLPFDLPEAESELVAGYHTEYSGMKFSMFFIAEYSNVVTASALMTTLFFGGYDIPFTTWDNVAPYSVFKWLATLLMFGAKTLFFVFTFMWVRWTLPRFRYDQLMSLGWKFMLPLALAYVMIIAGAMLALNALGYYRGWVFSGALIALNLVLVLLLFVGLDRGRLVSPAYGPMSERQLRELRNMSATRRRDLAEAAGGAD
ncbi:NAD(P)H-quinone oxidoreductase subunit 1 [Gemmatirosa kalamazoonensis]|uniref:NADH-quinone oxidoreductase subunit H n=1 Tax=Gemmatirosa kalamazoonensis TaxID=861299 RepID=W0RKI0_9BACT|nr:NADH-quinone oxidoreductase subunit NuoH [Gemmatirosa kalamazoonensis]AHG90825.1 NAD(P)H-quinone oxidoreductase subunit 1 [Gemmatirosa kalamazoonensis]